MKLGRLDPPRRTLSETKDACPPHGLVRPCVHVHTARHTHRTTPGLPLYDQDKDES